MLDNTILAELVNVHPADGETATLQHFSMATVENSKTPTESGYTESWTPVVGSRTFQLTDHEEEAGDHLAAQAISLIYSNAPSNSMFNLDTTALREEGATESSIIRKVITTIRSAQNYVAVSGRVGPTNVAIMHSRTVDRILALTGAPEPRFVTSRSFMFHENKLANMTTIAYDLIPENEILLCRKDTTTLALVVNDHYPLSYAMDFVNLESAAKQSILLEIKWW